MHQKEYQDILEQTLTLAQKLGASAAEASLFAAKGFSTIIRMQETETVENHQNKEINIKVYFNHKVGSAKTNDLSKEALSLTVKKACHIARFTEEDPCNGLADKEMLAFNYPQLDLYHPWKIMIEQAINLAKEFESMAFACDKRLVNSDGTEISNAEYFHLYGNTLGFIGNYSSSLHTISSSLVAEQNGDMQRDHDYTIARDAKDLEDISIVAKRVAQKTTARLGAKTLSTQQCPVIFEASVAKTIFGHFIKAISGTNLYQKSSFLVDHLHQKIFPEFLSVDEQPHLLKGMNSAPFDNEGIVTKNKFLVKNGVLINYVLGSYSARKLNMQSTGNAGGVHNLFVSPGEHNLPALLKIMDKGLLVTELIGHGVNIVTGNYSQGAFGFWVESGQIQYPVHGITIAGNLKDIFLNISAVGNDVDKRSNINTGSVLVSHMTIAGDKS